MVKSISKPPLPSKEDLLAFISAQEGKVGTREIARAFNMKNADRVALKRMLRELADDGRIERRRKKLHRAGALPSVVLADITGRDADGELVAMPAEWDEDAHGDAPKIRVAVPRRARPDEVAGVGDRALLRVEETGEETDAIRYSGRVIKIIDRVKHRVLGIFRAFPGGGGRLSPVDKKQLGREIAIPPGATDDAKDGDLVAVEVARQGRLGLATGRVKEKLGSLASERAVSLIAIHAHGIPHVFGREVLAEAEAAKPAELAGREDWRAVPFVTIDPVDAKDHDDAVHAAPDTDPKNPGGHVISVAIADVAHYVRPGSRLDREALVRGNSVYFPDRVVPMLPERISNDLCSLRPSEDRPALAVRMVVGADGRKRTHSFHRVLIRSAARLHYAQAQAAVSGRPDDDIGPLVTPVLEPLYAAYRALKRARDAARAARPRSARAQDRAQVRRHGRSRDHPRAPGSAPADRGVHDPRQCRGSRDARARARAARLSRARRAVAGEDQCAARVPRHARHCVAQRQRAAAGSLQSHPRTGQGPRRRAAGQ